MDYKKGNSLLLSMNDVWECNSNAVIYENLFCIQKEEKQSYCDDLIIQFSLHNNSKAIPAKPSFISDSSHSAGDYEHHYTSGHNSTQHMLQCSIYEGEASQNMYLSKTVI